MLASFLTVAVSALFVTVPVARTYQTEIMRTDTLSNFTEVFGNVSGATTRTSRLAAFDILNDTAGIFSDTL